MIARFVPIIGLHVSRLALAFFSLLVWLQAVGAAPFTVQGSGVNSNDFRITTFASGSKCPLGLARITPCIPPLLRNSVNAEFG